MCKKDSLSYENILLNAYMVCPFFKKRNKTRKDRGDFARIKIRLFAELSSDEHSVD